MIYVALLRGVNVGGKSRVDMKVLKKSFEDAGMKNVSTYINSGNIFFSDTLHKQKDLAPLLEKVIKKEFKLEVKVLIFNKDQVEKIVKAIPKNWLSEKIRCNVIFLWEEIDNPKIVEQLNAKEGVDVVKYVPGAVLFATEKELITKTGLTKIIGTKLYKQMTIRNSNTTQKLLEIMEKVNE